MSHFISPHDLRDMIRGGGELALVDVREELIFSQSHLLLARSVPLSRFEFKFRSMVPRRATRVVLCDDSDGLAARAAAILARNGYTNVGILSGGVAAWGAAGFELFSGVFVPSKAFGEYIEHADGTPNITAPELAKLIRDGADLVVLDSRPFDEYSRVSIPTSTNVPGAELVLRAREIAPATLTTVVVNCAGRTRSIIGAQSLINAGLPNKVMALRNGTMGWSLAGFICDSGKDRRAPGVSAKTLDWARHAAQRVADSCGVNRIDRPTLDAWRHDDQRTLYVFDVRDPDEYEAGHVQGAISAPGGQLVQATDQFVGTFGARIVLVDDAEVRAAMTGSWLRQMGYADVFMLAEKGMEAGWPAPPMLETEAPKDAAIDCLGLSELLSRNAATVIDLSMSPDYLREHIPGAWFAIRTRLERAFKKISRDGTFVLTSEDGVLASMAVTEATALTDRPVRSLAGGNAAWRAAGLPFAAEAKMADEAVDQWRKPYERSGNAKAMMQEYLDWEVDLLPRVKRDGSLQFDRFRPRLPAEAR
ncbi:MAG TPA: rhodanese-like domain-containing protein [Xanthobacteraceae bacterium]|nr:rhodanese-like domain-containing protein [Xanthobacteraceae bacterium]